MAKKLYRSTSDAMLGGVCGGLGEYFDIDSNLVRLVFIILAAPGGLGVFTYLALWLIVPEADSDERSSLGDRIRDGTDEIVDRARKIGDTFRAESRTSPTAAALVGIALVLVGIGFLLRNLGVAWLRWISIGTLWPALIILVGVAFLWRWMRRGA